ncbi:MAG: AI-2E family transporter [Pseudomonadota bacterium]
MKFVDVIGRWFNRYLANEEAIFLVVLLLVALVTITTLGAYLAPVLTGLVLAFVLEGLERRLEAYGLPRIVAFVVTFLIFLGGLIAFLLIVLPLAWRQLRSLIDAIPSVLSRIQSATINLPEAFEDVLTREQLQTYLDQLLGEIGNFSATLVETLLAQVPSIVALLIYLVLVPISVFFFLKDRDDLMRFFATLLPRERPILSRVGSEMNQQLANYVRGKFIEIFIVGAASYLTFEIMGLNYAALLGLLVGISVLVPYVGAALVTIPVALVAFSQWGWSGDFAWLMVAYAIIQALDGNVLVPLLFSEAVDLHPITIIVAVLAFGGVWGIWGVFFAIPLATLVKAIYNAWPRQDDEPGAAELAAPAAAES